MGSHFTKLMLTGLIPAGLLVSSSLYGWTPGTGNETDSHGFTVDTQSRNDVISFWSTVYQQSEGYEDRINWTGDIVSGNPGVTSSTFKDDVERRINYYRAMAGMTANIRISSSLLTVSNGSGPAAPAGTTKETAAQAAALMLSANTDEFLAGGGVATGAANPHSPPTSWSLDGSIARNGASHSNLSIGVFGPGAIDAYMSEDDQGAAGGENSDVGHRRYLLHSRLQNVATGDVAATGIDYYSANALYVFGDLLAPTNSPLFTPWPNSGFIPETIVPQRWSLSHPEADFSSATISMQDNNGNSIGTTIVSRNANYADETIVWKPDPSAITSSELEDVTYDVIVSNIIIGGNPTSHSYAVTIINPNRLTEYPTPTGNTSPPDTSAIYSFNQVDHAEEYELDVCGQTTATWLEGAEDSSSSSIIDGTSSVYELRASFKWNSYTGQEFWYEGDKAFRLAFPHSNMPLPREIFTINRTIIPKSGASLSFQLQRGYMTANTHLDVQYSTDSGGSWTTLETYTGNGNGAPDNSFSTMNVNLTSIGAHTLIRFLFHQPTATGVYVVTDNPDLPIGVFIDNIEVSNSESLESLAITSYAKTADFVTLDSTSGGGPLQAGNSYILRIRPKIGSSWLPYGPPLEVVPVPASSLSYEQWVSENYPLIGNFNDDYDGDGLSNGIEHLFGLNPMDASDAHSALSPTLTNGKLTLSHPVISGGTLEAECSPSLEEGSWDPVTVTYSDGVASVSFDVPAGHTKYFVRWKAIQP